MFAVVQRLYFYIGSSSTLTLSNLLKNSDGSVVADATVTATLLSNDEATHVASEVDGLNVPALGAGKYQVAILALANTAQRSDYKLKVVITKGAMSATVFFDTTVTERKSAS